MGDPINGAKRTVHVEDRVDDAIKLVRKNTPLSRAVIGESAGRGGSLAGRRGGSSRRGGGRTQKPYFDNNFWGRGHKE